MSSSPKPGSSKRDTLWLGMGSCTVVNYFLQSITGKEQNKPWYGQEHFHELRSSVDPIQIQTKEPLDSLVDRMVDLLEHRTTHRWIWWCTVHIGRHVGWRQRSGWGRRTGWSDGWWTPSTSNQKSQLLKHQKWTKRHVSKRSIHNNTEMFSLHGGRVVGALVDARAGRMIGWISSNQKSQLLEHQLDQTRTCRIELTQYIKSNLTRGHHGPLSSRAAFLHCRPVHRDKLQSDKALNLELIKKHQLHREGCTLRINLERAEKQKQAGWNRRMRVNFKEPYRHLSKTEIVQLRREGCEHVGCGWLSCVSRGRPPTASHVNHIIASV